MGVYHDNPKAIGGYVWIKADSTRDRRSRAGQIHHARIAYEEEHNVKLELITKSYDEAYGFLHQSAFRYKIIRKEDVQNAKR